MIHLLWLIQGRRDQGSGSHVSFGLAWNFFLQAALLLMLFLKDFPKGGRITSSKLIGSIYSLDILGKCANEIRYA